jgi:hypothetical protein
MWQGTRRLDTRCTNRLRAIGYVTRVASIACRVAPGCVRHTSVMSPGSVARLSRSVLAILDVRETRESSGENRTRQSRIELSRFLSRQSVDRPGRGGGFAGISIGMQIYTRDTTTNERISR